MTAQFNPTHRERTGELLELEHKYDHRAHRCPWGLFFNSFGMAVHRAMDDVFELPKVLQVLTHEEPEPLRVAPLRRLFLFRLILETIMSDDIKLPEPSGYFYEWGVLDSVHRSFDRRDSRPTTGHTMRVPYFTADQLRAAVRADRAERASAAEQVCYEAYQVVGSMLDDLGQFNTEQARKVLDNLSQAKKVHDDVLPWPSFKADGRKPLTSDQCDDIFDRVACEGPDGFECDWMDVIRATERAHDIVAKESGNECP